MKKEGNKTKAIAVLLLVILFSLQQSNTVGQNVIQLHEKNGKQKDFIVKTNKHVKIKTGDDQKIKGKITAITDSSIIITKNKSTEVPLKDIHYFYYKKYNATNIIAGVGFGALTGDAAFWSVYYGMFESSIVMGLISGAIIIPLPCLITCYFLIHKRRYNIELKYDLKIVSGN